MVDVSRNGLVWAGVIVDGGMRLQCSYVATLERQLGGREAVQAGELGGAASGRVEESWEMELKMGQVVDVLRHQTKES